MFPVWFFVDMCASLSLSVFSRSHWINHGSLWRYMGIGKKCATTITLLSEYFIVNIVCQPKCVRPEYTTNVLNYYAIQLASIGKFNITEIMFISTKAKDKSIDSCCCWCYHWYSSSTNITSTSIRFCVRVCTMICDLWLKSCDIHIDIHIHWLSRFAVYLVFIVWV